MTYFSYWGNDPAKVGPHSRVGHFRNFVKSTVLLLLFVVRTLGPFDHFIPQTLTKMENNITRLIFNFLLLYVTSSFAIFTCQPNESPAFLRISRARLTGSPEVISTAGDDLSCARHCRNNVEPTTGANRACASFNYDGRETCYFFNNAATPAGSGVLAPNPSANNFYYEKVCLPGVSNHQACSFRSHTFERIRKSKLEGFVKKSMQVDSREQCLSSCLMEENFVCRSVNYNYNAKFCEMSTEDRRNKPQYMRQTPQEPVDYFDNNCLTRQNRCGENGGNLVFVKSANFEIHFYDHTTSVVDQEGACLQMCLDSLNTFCRSVEFSPSVRKCIISDEDTFSRADQQGTPITHQKDYYEPICVQADLTSSTCRQQAAFERFIGAAIEGQPIATAQGVTVSDCISLCFQNLNCKSLNYDRTALTCYVYGISRAQGNVKNNPSTDYYEYHCDSQFGGMAMCTDQGIRFVVNTKEPYTGAIYAAERYSTCHAIVENRKQISMMFPPPTISGECGTKLTNGKLEAIVVVSLDGVLPHEVTTEWDRFYKVTCDTNMKAMGEGTVVITSIYDAGEAKMEMLPAATPGPVTASLSFVDENNNLVTTTEIGQEIFLIAKSEQAGPKNMFLMDCTANRMGGNGDSITFKVLDNGCPRYPALLGAVVRDIPNNRLAAQMKAFRLDGSTDIQMVCSVMFCAGPTGCPPSNCLDSGTGELFQSFKRKKRGIPEMKEEEEEEENVKETLSAIIRVLATDEKEELKKVQKSENIIQVETQMSEEMMCIAESSFIAIIVTVSLLCVLFSGIIVAWGCSRLRAPNSKLPTTLPPGHRQPTHQTRIVPVVGAI